MTVKKEVTEDQTDEDATPEQSEPKATPKKAAAPKKAEAEAGEESEPEVQEAAEPEAEETVTVHLKALDTNKWVAACGADGDDVGLTINSDLITCPECADRV